MADFTLTATPVLGGYDQRFDDTRLRELTGMALVSVALPRGGEAKAEKAIKKAFGVALPSAGQSVLSSMLSGDGHTRLIRLGPDQAMVHFDHDTPDAEPLIAKRLGGAAYTTDQSDAWVGLEISGPGAVTALERICPLDLNDVVFAVDAAARTVMEHLGVLIIRNAPDSYQLFSASSSARSFLHAVEQSIENTV